MSENPYDRPILVTIIAVIYALLAAFLLVMGIIGVASGLIDSEYNIELIGGVALVVVGLITLVISMGFFKGWSIMWYLGLIFTIIELIGCIITLVFGSVFMVVAILIDILILYYLFRPNVKLFFLKKE